MNNLEKISNYLCDTKTTHQPTILITEDISWKIHYTYFCQKNLYIWKKKTTTIISPIAIIDANTTINKEPGNTFAISMYTHK